MIKKGGPGDLGWSGSLSWTINQKDPSAAGKGDKQTQEGGAGWGLGTNPFLWQRLQVLSPVGGSVGNSQSSDPELVTRSVRATEGHGGGGLKCSQLGYPQGLKSERSPQDFRA